MLDDRNTLPDARGCHPFELLPGTPDGLVLYDDEHALLAWAREEPPGLGDHAPVIVGALYSLSRLRERRLAAMAADNETPQPDAAI